MQSTNIPNVLPKGQTNSRFLNILRRYNILNIKKTLSEFDEMI